MNDETSFLRSLIREFIKLPSETEWLEFKSNNSNPEDIGEYISALSNSAAYNNKLNSYMIWGIKDETHEIIGTSFNPRKVKKGNTELENWLLQFLSPKINFSFKTVQVDEKLIVVLEIQAAFRHPVQFKNIEYIRVGTYKKKLKDFPEKERELWRYFDNTPFEKEIASENISSANVLKLIDYPTYFDLLDLPLPEDRKGILDALEAEEMIIKTTSDRWNITNLGAILFAKNLNDFRKLKRKSVRVIHYNGTDKIKTLKEQVGVKGYAAGFDGLIGFITNILPSNEVIEKAFRTEVAMFPDLAIRELVANAIIHQDFYSVGNSPMIEIFSNRMEITNAGEPLVKVNRFLDSPPKSRNEALASFMRRIGVCEERGSGIDKVVFETEFYQLPAPLFEVVEDHTRVTLFTHKEFREMDKQDKIRACYLHCCLKYVQKDYMTNTSLRGRFGIDSKNSAMVSRIIKDTIESNKIKIYDETVGTRAMKYVPNWE